MMKSKVHIISIAVLILAIIMSGCSGSSRRNGDKSTMNRRLAKAVQALSGSAELGSKAYMDEGYKEREPNPNAYVGELLYRRYCGQCHASGKAADIVNHRVTQPDQESDYYIIRYGYHEMPAFRNRLTKFQILDIQAYITPKSMATKSQKSPRPMPDDGENSGNSD